MSFSESLKRLNEFDLSELSNFDESGAWPGPIKLVLCLLLFGAIIFLGYTFHLRDINQQLIAAQKTESSLKREFEEKAFQVVNLSDYKQQMAQMQESFGALLRQLPSDTEVPGLLEDITQTGLGSGLKFESIKLLPEQRAEFYIELPIEIKVVGGYHEIGTFVSTIAGLPRIVTLHDFEIEPGNSKLASALEMTIMAKTYRYIDSNGDS